MTSFCKVGEEPILRLCTPKCHILKDFTVYWTLLRLQETVKDILVDLQRNTGAPFKMSEQL